MLTDYCWMLLRETPKEEYKRQKDNKLSVYYYIYLFVSMILYIDTSFMF